MNPVRARLRIYLLVLLGVMVLSTLGFSYAEKLSIIDSLYFSIVTVATVGYGDIHPATQAGKLLAVLLIISGVGTFLGVIANATEMLLSRHEKNFRRQKMHMLLGVFFSEVGMGLLSRFTAFDRNADGLIDGAIIGPEWKEEDFSRLSRTLKKHDYAPDSSAGDLEELRVFLGKKGNVLLRLLESPHLLEQESFSELLRAIFHLREELMNRPALKGLPETDYQHLSGDIKRVYILLVRHWLQYMLHLKEFFPYLFSLAVRMNPFDRNASAIVE